jgi:hypothetical protein
MHMLPMKTISRIARASDPNLGNRGEQSGRGRPFVRSFEENSRRYLTKRIGDMDRCPTGALDQPQIRPAPEAGHR